MGRWSILPDHAWPILACHDEKPFDKANRDNKEALSRGGRARPAPGGPGKAALDCGVMAAVWCW